MEGFFLGFLVWGLPEPSRVPAHAAAHVHVFIVPTSVQTIFADKGHKMRPMATNMRLSSRTFRVHGACLVRARGVPIPILGTFRIVGWISKIGGTRLIARSPIILGILHMFGLRGQSAKHIIAQCLSGNVKKRFQTSRKRKQNVKKTLRKRKENVKNT